MLGYPPRQLDLPAVQQGIGIGALDLLDRDPGFLGTDRHHVADRRPAPEGNPHPVAGNGVLAVGDAVGIGLVVERARGLDRHLSVDQPKI